MEKLGGASAETANLLPAQPLLPEKNRSAIALDGGDRDHHGLPRSVDHDPVIHVEFRRQAPAKGERAAEVLRREVQNIGRSHAPAELQGMLAQRTGRIVLDLPAIDRVLR